MLGFYGVVNVFSSSATPKTALAAVATSWKVDASSSFVVPGHLGSFVWPSTGEGAVGLEGAGVIAGSPDERIVPIASMTKMMTAITILQQYPLTLGEQGPILTMTASDAKRWVVDSGEGDATVQVNAGEKLSEYQLLEALLMPSGDNIAETLAIWDAGSVSAFVAKMNANAAAMGLTHTIYADPSGVSPGSRSTASDQVIVAGALMANPVVRQIVAQSSVAFPVAGTIRTVNPALGVDGIIGVKSGFTNEAMSCLTVAATDSADGKPVTLIVVSTGNKNGLVGAAHVDERLLTEEKSDLVAVQSPQIPVSSKVSTSPGVTPLTLTPVRSVRPTLIAWKGAKIDRQILVLPGASTTTTGVVAKMNFKTSTGSLGSVRLENLPTVGNPA
jgi:D-alanyl-D-alanine carboxypeptidase (penicillin-binding protein 5/6)